VAQAAGNGTVDFYKIDPVNKSATKTKSITGTGDGSLESIGFKNDGNLYAYDERSAFSQGTMYFINWATSTAQALGSSGTPSILGGDYDAVRNVFWAGDEWNGKIYQLSLTNSSIQWTSNSTWSIGPNGDFYDMDVTPDGEVLAVASTSSSPKLSILKLDPETKTWTKFLDLPTGGDIRIASVKEVSYIGGNFNDRDLSAHDLSRINFTGSTFLNSNFSATNLKYSNFANASLNGALLFGTNFAETNLTGATFQDARFTRFTIWPAGFVTAGKGMLGPKLDYTSQNFSGRDLSSNDFMEAKFSGANLSNCNLNGSHFDKVNLTNSNLNGALLFGTDFTETNLTGATLNGARYSDNTIWPAGFIIQGKGLIKE
jgi:uncharacterized protein YjbI with pentapeptide repeats